VSTFLEAVREPHQSWISPRRVSATLNISLKRMAEVTRLHRNTLTQHPDSPEVQMRLGQVVRIVTRAAAMLDGDIERAKLWFRYEPLSGFDYKTAEQLVEAGHADAVEVHLDMLTEGIYA
jgi:uncharacterized protein (DUF2384 family)